MASTPSEPPRYPDVVDPPDNGAVFVCKLYLMDTQTRQVLPNRRYRSIDPVSGRKLTGWSDSRGRIGGYFSDAHVEVLPERGRTYLDGALNTPVKNTIPETMGHIIEVRTSLLNPNTATTINSVTPPLNIPADVNHVYMNWLDNQTGDVWSNYKYVVVDHMGDATITSVKLEGIPSVLSGANLIGVKDLMNSFASNQATYRHEYKYLNTLRNSPEAADAHISNLLEGLISSCRLPPQYFYVIGHGSPRDFMGYQPDGTLISFDKNDPRQLKNLYELMKANGYDDKRTVVFVACNLGNGADSFAEQFAALKNNGTVYAFTGMGVFAAPDDPTTFACMATYYATHTIPGTPPTTQELYYASNTIGHWRIFNTATAAIADSSACLF